MKTSFLPRTGGAVLVPLLLTLCLALFCGCSSYTILPRVLPPIKGLEGISLSAVSVLVVNAEKDATEQDILTPTKGRTGLQGNRQAWAKRLVESLSRELAVRGARVRSDAPVVLSVTLPEITFYEAQGQIQFTVRVVVSSSVGWAKEYEGASLATGRSTGSAQEEADRLAGLALADVVRKMLGDTAFLVRLGTKS